ncbi:tyrosine-type recombinase/integrase [Arthrobacter dokdonensis]|uniref:tyrosine-type recombinase/integrase n=1 Tax=Arthrobacter dokdonellae TaxID=2211210 RepID=UPI0014948426|nr:tyrosine-type recombinase/integrase [Arthrobacter dokdonellae]
METAKLREASGRVIVALTAAGRSRTTIKRHEAVFNAFAGFVEARGQGLPNEADCLDFIAERSGSRLGSLREPTRSRHAQLARRPLILLMEALDGILPQVGQPTSPLIENCPATFRTVRDEYLAACRQRGNAEASVTTKQRAADQFLAYLEEVGRETLDQVQAQDLAGFWVRLQRRSYAPKTTGSLRSGLADFLRHLAERGQVQEDLAGRLPPQRYPRRGQLAPYPWKVEEIRLVLDKIDRQSAIGKRDYAMVLLTARLGLRVGDLRCLELGWFDWRAKTVAFSQHKTGLPLTLPLPGDVGWAVIDYIRHGRPEAGCRQVFVKHRYPFTAFGSSTSAGCRLRYYARRAGIVFPPGRSHGLHSLRGALAVAMLQTDTPPPVVAAVLGHATTNTTAAHYLRLDTEHLRGCALDVEDVLDVEKGAQS